MRWEPGKNKQQAVIHCPQHLSDEALNVFGPSQKSVPLPIWNVHSACHMMSRKEPYIGSDWAGAQVRRLGLLSSLNASSHVAWGMLLHLPVPCTTDMECKHDPKPYLGRLHGVSKTSHGWCGGLEADTLWTVHLVCNLGFGLDHRVRVTPLGTGSE